MTPLSALRALRTNSRSLWLFGLSKPAQAGLEPQASAPKGGRHRRPGSAVSRDKSRGRWQGHTSHAVKDFLAPGDLRV